MVGIRVAQIDVPDLEGRTERVRGSVQYDSVAPAHGKHVVVVVRFRSPRPKFMEPRLRVVGDEPLELDCQRLDFPVGRRPGTITKPASSRAANSSVVAVATEPDLLGSVERDLDPHLNILPDALTHRRCPKRQPEARPNRPISPAERHRSALLGRACQLLQVKKRVEASGPFDDDVSVEVRLGRDGPMLLPRRPHPPRERIEDRCQHRRRMPPSQDARRAVRRFGEGRQVQTSPQQSRRCRPTGEGFVQRTVRELHLGRATRCTGKHAERHSS